MQLLLRGLAAALLSTAAHASVIFTLGNHPTGADLNVIIPNATGTTITGTLTGFPGTDVQFASTQTLNGVASPAEITATSGPLTDVMVSVVQSGHPGEGSFGRLIIDPVLAIGDAAMGGNATVSVLTREIGTNTLQTTTFTGLAVLRGSNNYLTIQSTTGTEVMLSAELTVPGGFTELLGPTIAGPFQSGNGFIPPGPTGMPVTPPSPDTSGVPEPASSVLLGAGLLCLSRVSNIRRYFHSGN